MLEITDKRVNAKIYKHNESAARRFIKKLRVGDELSLGYLNDIHRSLSEADLMSQRQLSRTYIIDDQQTAVAYISGKFGDDLASWVGEDIDDGAFRAFAEPSTSNQPPETFRVRVIGGEDITAAMIDQYRQDAAAWRRAQRKPPAKAKRTQRRPRTPDEEAFAAIASAPEVRVDRPQTPSKPNEVEKSTTATDIAAWIAAAGFIVLLFVIGACLFSF